MRPAGLAYALVLASSCAHPEPAPPAAAPLPVASVAPTATTTASVEPTPVSGPRKLRFVKKEDECSVVDDATGEVVGHATSKNTAAGGSNVECYDFLSEGKIIRFMNSRGIYAKDARPGAKDAQTLPCGEGAFANDVKTCVRLDVPEQLWSGSERAAADAPFDIELCSASGKCTKLVTIPRGLNRLGPPGEPGPVRTWDAAYCADDRVLVVAEKTLRLFEVPSGKLLAKASAKSMRIERCSEGVAHLLGPANEKLVFNVGRESLAPAQ